MLDMKMIRQNAEWFKQKMADRGVDGASVDHLMELDQKRRDLIVKSEALKAERNEVSEEISQLKRNKENADAQIKRMREVGAEIKQLDADLETTKAEQDNLEAHLPNIPNDKVPVSLLIRVLVPYRQIPKYLSEASLASFILSIYSE